MIRIGPSGWTHPSLERLWPKISGEAFDPLEFLGGFFGCVEVDATVHAIPRKEHVGRWVQSLADHPRTRLVLRLPRSIMDFSAPAETRKADAERVQQALAPLLRREKLGALVAVLESKVLFGASELRFLTELSRILAGAPLVLEAAHGSWYERGALNALRGANWSLAHVEPEDRWDAPPRHHAPTGKVGMLRLLRPGLAPPPMIGALARRAQALSADVDEVIVVTANGSRPGADPLTSFAAAIEVKYVLRGENPVAAWPEIVAAFPHLEAVTSLAPSDLRNLPRGQ